MIRTTIVIMPKGEEEFRGIGLVKVIWMVCTSIMNNRLRSAITLHVDLHGLIQGYSTGTSALEENLVQELTGI